ncbi:MAG: cytochrome C oxidase subunit IV family protein [Phycisphaerae bacterium]|jgi:cytochrome c oxidase subunit 4|nr:cytochrome C oxidase subunit IV family protein [Phycisphaerae bacterium]NLG42217.1 caa(3)-type oxidase subunit IV [Phycisphaerae bacterium]HOO17219.1 cytochrome C oxidase subunit IV family protein [Phycisphaerae bacterium]HPC22185.1 cytochrome C oxidase subunit IV family protein [Phycisphaerae bacterium]HRS28526.1 cytochrome C oxidase subunit IV family protein [Phycisphaerae bacterium]
MTAPASPAIETAPARVGHFVPLWVLVLTLVALLALTAVTVGVTMVPWLDLGHVGNLWIALLIATIKAILVGLFFMHLRYEKPFIAFILFVTLCFVGLFIGLVLLDSTAYQPSIQQYREVDPVRYAPDLLNR